MEYPQPRGGRLRNRSPSRGSSMVSHPGVPYKNRDMTVTPTPPPAALDRRTAVFARLRLFAEAAIGLALLGAAAYVLHREFSDVHLADVITEFEQLSTVGIVLSVDRQSTRLNSSP